MANIYFSGKDSVTGQFKHYIPGTDTFGEPSFLSGATTGNALTHSALSLTSGSLIRGIVPNSGFTGRIIDIRDNTGTPVDKFVVDATGKITVGSADTSLLTSGTLGVTRGGTGLSSIASGKLLYASSSNTLAELTLDSTLGISSGTLSVQPDTVVEKVRISKAGTLQGTRREINLVEGSNITLTVADDGANNRVNVTVAASASAGSRWDQISDPTTNLSLTMAGNTTSFTWGNATSTSNLFSLSDGASNSGTGYIFSVNTAASSLAKPVRFTVGGTSNGVAMDNTGNFAALGSGVLTANALNGLSSNGMVVRTAAGTFTNRSIATANSGRITVTDGDGVSGNPTLDLATSGVSASTYTKVTVDVYGRVTSATSISSSDVTSALTYTPVNKAGDTMTGALTLSADPTNALHAATKQYVDALTTGLTDYKESVRAGVLTNITISNPGTSSFDGVTLSNGDRVFLGGQSTASQNGLYIFNGSGSAMTRSTDADSNAEVTTGMYFWIEEGSSNGNTAWRLQTAAPITLGTTALTFVKVSALGQITAGAGLTKTGDTIDVVTANSGRIVVNADNIDLASGIVTTGTYKSVTVDTYGRVTAGTNPTTLSGFGITDAQTLDSTLTALAAYNTNGILTQTAADTFTGRTLTGTSNRITITNGDGVSGNPTFDIGTDVVTLTGSQTLTNKTLTSPVINFGSDANGDILVRSGGAYNRLAVGATGQVLTVVSGIPAWASVGGTLLSTTTSINAKTTGTTNLYTVPSGKTAIITKAIVVPTAASSITQGPTAGIGVAAGEDDIFSATELTGLTATTKAFAFDAIGTYVMAAATEVIKFGIDTAASGTSMTITVYLFGYLI